MSSSVRALFLCPDLRIGGAERHWSILLPRLAARGVDVRLVALNGGGPFLDVLVAEGVDARAPRSTGRTDLRPLAGLLRRWRPDVIVSRAVNAQLVAQALGARLRVPHVFNEHRQPGAAYTARRERLVRAVAPRVAGVVAVAESQRHDLIARGYPPQRTWVIANGVPALASDVPPADRAGLGLAAQDVVVACVAALRPEKRVGDLLDAVGRAHCADARVRGLVVGDGPDLPRLRAHPAVRSGAVLLLGARNDVPALLAAADAFALTSAHEASPMAVLEAMAHGLPVLATSVGDVPTLVLEGITGRLVGVGATDDLADAMVALAAQPDRGRAMGEQGRRRQRERFDAEGMASSYAELLTATATAA